MSVIRKDFNFANEFKPEWITKELDDSGIDYLENFGFHLCDKRSESDNFPGFNAATSSQLRNIFSEIKRIHAKVASDGNNADWSADFRMLRPKIAYNAAKVMSQRRDNQIKDFKTLMELAHRQVNGEAENFLRFSQFTEAIIAYHKVYGGQ